MGKTSKTKGKKTAGVATGTKRQKKTPQKPGFVRTDDLAESVFEDATGFRGVLGIDATLVIGNVVYDWHAKEKFIIVNQGTKIPTIVYEKSYKGMTQEQWDKALIETAKQ